jgi:hypothetical protein
MKFDACIDAVTPDGRIIGWACRPGHVERLRVGLFHEGSLIAEAVAQDYRAGLLDAGYGLGHCEFTARLRTIPPPGEQTIELRLMGEAEASLAFTLAVPPPRPVAEPPRPKSQWTDAEVLAGLGHFRLPDQLAALGPERFTDGVFRFVLGRWPEDEMLEEARRAVDRGGFDVEGFVVAVLESGERRCHEAPPLTSPFDYRFPFRYPPLSDIRDRSCSE